MPKLCIGQHVDDLAADHAAMARRFRQPRDQRAAHFGDRMGARIGQDLEGDGQQRVARQHRRHLVKGDMGGGTAAAQIVIVHAGQIVMHQASRCAAPRWRRRPARHARIIHPEQPRRMQHQEGPQPLAARHDGIAHGLLHPGLAARGLGQDRVQGRIHQLGAGGYGIGQLGRCPPWWPGALI